MKWHSAWISSHNLQVLLGLPKIENWAASTARVNVEAVWPIQEKWGGDFCIPTTPQWGNKTYIQDNINQSLTATEKYQLASKSFYINYELNIELSSASSKAYSVFGAFRTREEKVWFSSNTLEGQNDLRVVIFEFRTQAPSGSNKQLNWV